MRAKYISAGIADQSRHVAILSGNIPCIGIRSIDQDFPRRGEGRSNIGCKSFIVPAYFGKDRISLMKTMGKRAEQTDIFRSGKGVILQMIMKDHYRNPEIAKLCDVWRFRSRHCICHQHVRIQFQYGFIIQTGFISYVTEWVQRGYEKRATPLAAGGGAHDEGVGGVLFSPSATSQSHNLTPK